MNRSIDVTGTSGTGTVAEGVEFTDGTVVIRWRPVPATSTCAYDSLVELLKIHGHDGATTIEWLDDEQPEMCRNDLHELPYTPDDEYPEYDGCSECDQLAYNNGLNFDEVTKAAHWHHTESITLSEALGRAIEERI
jgi:hypothetical protein